MLPSIEWVQCVDGTRCIVKYIIYTIAVAYNIYSTLNNEQPNNEVIIITNFNDS